MSAPEVAQAIRNPRRGLAHRLAPPGTHGVLAGDSTACGKFARDMTESIDVDRTDPSDRCMRCWADTGWPATR